VWVQRRGGTRILQGERSSSSSLVAGLGVVSCNALVSLVSGYGPGYFLFRNEIPTPQPRRDSILTKLALALHTWYAVSQTPDGVCITTDSLQPLRPHPKVFQVLVKTHKSTIFLSLPNVTAISAVKEQVFQLSRMMFSRESVGYPAFEMWTTLCYRERSWKGEGAPRYEVLTDDQLLRDIVGDWAVLFMQFKNESGAYNL
jgi:hypothetical protein